MRALCPRLHTLELARDRKINRLIVAGLEMQERHELRAAPVASEQDALTKQIQRTRDVASILLRHHQQRLICHHLAEHREEFARQIRMPPLAASRIHVKIPEAI